MLFGVRWGDPLALVAVVLAFALVGAAAGLLLGAVMRTQEQAGGVGVPLALALAAVGGSMVPAELFPPALARVSRLTPHAWGNAALTEILAEDAGLGAVLDEVAVLLAFALVLGVAAAVLLRQRLLPRG